jgi:hypothetical protein
VFCIWGSFRELLDVGTIVWGVMCLMKHTVIAVGLWNVICLNFTKYTIDMSVLTEYVDMGHATLSWCSDPYFGFSVRVAICW